MCYGCCDLENNPLLACWPVVACGVPDFLLVTMSWLFCFLPPYFSIVWCDCLHACWLLSCLSFHVFVIGCVSCLTGSCLLVLLLYLHVDSKIYTFCGFIQKKLSEIRSSDPKPTTSMSGIFAYSLAGIVDN